MKILISANSPEAGTGYGVQCALLATRLCREGHEVAVACTYGQQIGMKVWHTPDGHPVRLYWQGERAASDDILSAHALQFFDGDHRGGWIILLNDVWAITPAGIEDLREFNVVAWAPVDHITAPPAVTNFLKSSFAVPVAMSKHAEKAFLEEGLSPAYIPLAVDTSVYKPTYQIPAAGIMHDSRDYHRIPREAFVVGMVAMNKGWVFDRKGFSEAFYAFALLARTHPNCVLYLHTDPMGYDGLHLRALAMSAGIHPAQMVFSTQYALRHGFTPDMMASMYTSFDVLLAPSHGEGFCVPMIEAQACGTPVIVSDATAQTELVGAGWLVDGQPVWDQSQLCPAFLPSIKSIYDRLVEAYHADLVELQEQAIGFARQYDADRVFDEYWRPFLETLQAPIPEDNKPSMDRVAVIVPAMRPNNIPRLVSSFEQSTDGTATLYVVADPDNVELQAAVKNTSAELLISDRGHTFAQKANYGHRHTTEDWIFLCGDDCEFTPGWLDKPREISTRWDVIGTNDSEPGRIRNRDVAEKRHSDHWFTRRAYIDDEGSCLESPGVFCPESYNHWYVDKEVVGLAQARGVFTPCLDSIVIHHHPGFDGDEEARKADPVYMAAVENMEHDRIQFMRRVPLIEGQRVSRGR
jgi:glycosyltransferase involved in cell wall biosynthesis